MLQTQEYQEGHLTQLEEENLPGGGHVCARRGVFQWQNGVLDEFCQLGQDSVPSALDSKVCNWHSCVDNYWTKFDSRGKLG